MMPTDPDGPPIEPGPGPRRANITATWADLASTVELQTDGSAALRAPAGLSPPAVAADLEQFLRDAIASGLVSDEELRAVGTSLQARLAMAGGPTAEDLARELVRLGRLTPYQAGAVLQGKTRGLVIGNYHVLEKIGAGGMGLVFKAWHRRLKRVVALKVLPPSFTSNAAAVQRFQREAEAAAHLDHPNIVAAIDAAEDRGLHFFVMEYVDGCDLARLVRRRGPLPIGQAVDWIRQAARGLAEAHAHRIYHRDIKPSNLLLETSGRVKISDLGLARLGRSGDDPGGPAAEAAGLTRDGAMMGTVDFMPPEQAYNSRLADHRSDIYSLGCTLYFLLTGQVPFPAETVMARLLAHREVAFPSVREIRPEASAALDALLLKMTAKAPEARHASVDALLAELDALPDHDADAEPPSRPAPASGARTLPSSDSTIAFDRLARLEPSGQAETDAPAPLRRLPPLSSRVVAVAGVVLALSVVAMIIDGRRPRTGELVVRTGGHDVRLTVLQAGRPVVPPTDRRFFELMPGSYDLELVDPPPGLALEPAEAVIERGRRVVVKVVGTLRPRVPIPVPVPVTPPVVPPPVVEASAPAPAPPSPPVPEVPGLVGTWVHGEGAVWSVAFLADGRTAISAGQHGRLRAWNLPDGAAAWVVPQDGTIYAAAASPDGRFVATGGGDGLVRLHELPTRREAGRLAGHSGKVNALAFGPGGRLLLSASDDGTARLWDVITLRERATMEHESPVVAVAFARAGRLALSLGRDAVLQRADVDDPRRTTRLAGRGVFLAMTPLPTPAGSGGDPDGRIVAGTDTGRLAVWDLGRGGAPRAIDGGPIDWINGLSALPGSRHVVAAYQGGRLLVWDTAQGRVIHTFNAIAAAHLAVAVSPDGHFALTGDDDGRVRLWRLPRLDDAGR